MIEAKTKASDRVGAYRAMFLAPEGKELSPTARLVLEDLKRICYVTKTTATNNPTAMAVAEGRRQVWLHIQTQLKLTDRQIFQLDQGSDLL